MDTKQGTGFVIWITGMNRSGKSTLAAHVASRLTAVGRSVQLLDENGEAAFMLEGLGSEKEDHAKAVARLGYVAKAVMRAGGVAVCAALSPYRDAREQLRKEARRLVEVFVDCSMEKLQRRDSEGLYRRALAGELLKVPGVDVPYEPPSRPDVTVHTDQVSVEEGARAVFQALVDLKYVGHSEFVGLTGGLRPRRGKAGKATSGKKKRVAKAVPGAARSRRG